MSNFIEVALNYLFIQISIIIFITPFYIWYKREHPGVNLKSLIHNEQLEGFLSSPQANYLVFVWAAAEAVCWFIIPEFLLLLVIFVRVKSKRKLLINDILGTFIGTIIGLLLASYTNFNITDVPYITQGMVDQVMSWYQDLGSFGLFFQPFSGVPYKVFVHTIHYYSVNLLGFIFLAALIRIARYYILYLLFSGLHPFLHRLISSNYIPIFLLSCLIFSMLFLNVYHQYGSDYLVNSMETNRIKEMILFFRESIR